MVDVMKKGVRLILRVVCPWFDHSACIGGRRELVWRVTCRYHAVPNRRDRARSRPKGVTGGLILPMALLLLGQAWSGPPSTSWAIGIGVVHDRPSGTTYKWESPTPAEPSQNRVELRPQNSERDGEEPVLHKAMDSVFDSKELRPHLNGVSSGSLDPDEFRKAFSTMHESLLGGSELDGKPIDQKIRYRMPDAGEVYLVWGINGWKPITEDLRPKGTTIDEHGHMSTRMNDSGDDFQTTLRVLPGTAIDFGFWIAKKKDGTEFGIWDADKYPSHGYQILARAHNPVSIVADPTMVRFRKPGDSLQGVRATQEIRYYQPGAKEVFLMWGINGWRVPPESDLPAGSIVKKGKTLTPLQRDREAFTTKMKVPLGTMLDYGFLVTRTSDGRVTEVWDDNHRQFFHTVVKLDGVTTVKPTISLPR